MESRRFGRTGLEVSALALGGGWVGGLLITADDATRRQAIRLAQAGGITWIDTAPQYGGGRSEEALGWLLQEVDRQPYLSTKVMLDPEHLDDIGGQVERSMAASLRRLRRSSVELVQLHNPIMRAGGGRSVQVRHVLGERGAAEALERLREQGLARFIGFTALGDGDLLQEVVASGRFDSAQVYYNLLNPSAGRPAMPAGWSGQDFSGLIEACRRHGVAVMNIRVLAAGILATEVRHGREGMLTAGATIASEEAAARRVFEVLGPEHGTRAQRAIRFALAHPDISCVVVGVAELAHLEEALRAAELGPLPEEALRRLEPVYASGFARKA